MTRVLPLMALLLALAATAAAEPVASPIPIGVAVATTSNVALFGEEQVNGAKIAEAMLNAKGGVNGTPFKIIYQDTAGDEAGAINAFQSLITAKVTAIIGPTLTQQAFAADPIADRAKVPVIGPSNTAKGIAQIGPYVGRISAPMTDVAPNSLKYVLSVDPKIKKVAVMFAQNDAFCTSETGIFQEAIKGLNLDVVTIQKFQTTDTDFTTQVTAVLGAGADMVVISGLAADGGNLVKQLRQLGYQGPIVGGNGFNSTNMLPVCGPLCEGILVAQAYSPKADNAVNKAFVEKYQEAYKKIPPQFAAQAYASVQVIVEALAKVEKDSGKKITAMELAEVRELLNKNLQNATFSTPMGEITLDGEGEVHQKQFFVSSIKMNPDGKTGDYVIVNK